MTKKEMIQERKILLGKIHIAKNLWVLMMIPIGQSFLPPSVKTAAKIVQTASC